MTKTHLLRIALLTSELVSGAVFANIETFDPYFNIVTP